MSSLVKQASLKNEVLKYNLIVALLFSSLVYYFGKYSDMWEMENYILGNWKLRKIKTT